MYDESRFIERLKRLIPRSLQGAIPIGDDTAILNVRSKSLLFTTDVIVEGVDFRLGKGGARPHQIGHKALAVNLSDIAAMGGEPLAFVCAMGMPKHFPAAQAEGVAKGMIRLARQFGLSWVGGDLSRADRLFVSIALLGKARYPILRQGAKPEEAIYVTGRLGGSLAGRHLNFIPRIEEARWLASHFRPGAAIDISDGFIQDLEHLLKASRVGAKISLDSIPISSAAWKSSVRRRQKALEAALTDGEDFELLFTYPKKRGRILEQKWRRRFPNVSLTQVGEIVHPHPGEVEWRQGGRSLRRLWFRKKGFKHF